jgi:hypothetical protein
MMQRHFVAYPSILFPTATEVLYTATGSFSVPKATPTLRPWTGSPIRNTFGGKPVIDYAGNPASPK